MMQQSFTIPQQSFPGLNEIIKAAKAHPMAYSSMKKDWGEVVAFWIRKAKLKPMRGPVSIHFEWVEKNGRRDPDNIRAGSKFALDALVKAKIIPNDNMKTIWGMADSYRVDKANHRVVVTLTQVEMGCD